MEGDGSQATSGSPTDSQHDPGKMFIGGLSWQTSPDSLRDYFSKFGEIRECMVMRDPTTKRSRLTLKLPSRDVLNPSICLFMLEVLKDTICRDRFTTGSTQFKNTKQMVTRTKKIFVGGLSANTVVEDVKQYFEQFGKFGSLGYTIMGKTADLTVVQKTIIDTLHKEDKPQTFIAKEAGCSQSALAL
ncbi:hypothetical protein QTP70_007897 [Hemibagrus guttatus]|uniref:RRM domain-containing protein n=1 Tax=Hemibagrus guttatus TaxID=175788 RepID=A0AAE0QSA1_9TELE|nr:hypothetical protein QTP70_007897 [Hemibagrus guttatus]